MFVVIRALVVALHRRAVLVRVAVLRLVVMHWFAVPLRRVGGGDARVLIIAA